jgi:hypothetical protein
MLHSGIHNLIQRNRIICHVFIKRATKLMEIFIIEYYSHQVYAELQHFSGKTVSAHRKKLFGIINMDSGATDELLIKQSQFIRY